MSLLISHRGNLNGPIPEEENKPSYIINALSAGYDVEVDVWIMDVDKLFLGHDKPQYPITEDFLENPKLWCHAKNVFAFSRMLRSGKIHSFWHQNDDYTLTSKGFVWTYTGKPLIANSICVLPELNNNEIPDFVFGICSDFIVKY